MRLLQNAMLRKRLEEQRMGGPDASPVVNAIFRSQMLLLPLEQRAMSERATLEAVSPTLQTYKRFKSSLPKRPSALRTRLIQFRSYRLRFRAP